MGMTWGHLRMCQTCGHVGCCDNSIGKHATAHHQGTGHPIIGPAALAELRPATVVLMNPVYRQEVAAQLAALGLRPELLSL